MVGRAAVGREAVLPLARDVPASAPPPGRFRRSQHAPRLPWRLLSRVSSARRIALVAVALFELSEVALLWSKGIERGNGVAVLLGFAVLVLLIGFEVAEHAAAERDRELSLEISEWLLPQTPPSMEGVEVAFGHRIASRVGSDYFAAFPRWCAGDPARSPRLFIVLADVAGAGLQGALLMATLQASLRALADSGMPLRELASQMNRWWWDRSLDGRHFTVAFLAELNPLTGALEYVSAGHQPPLIHRSEGDLERLDIRGYPLGILPDVVYEMGRTSLRADDTLVIFTDGVVRAEDHRREPFGESRVADVVVATRGLAASAVVNHIRSALLSYCGSLQQQDDMSLVVVRRCP